MTKITINDIKKTPVTNSSSELINMYQYYTRPDIRGVKLTSTQRGPAWNKHDINTLLSDIYDENTDKGIKTNKRKQTNKGDNKKNDLRFFGSILLSNEENNSHKLIDGQQRTTAGLLFIAVIRDIIKDTPNLNPQGKKLKNLCNKILLYPHENSTKSTKNVYLFLDLNEEGKHNHNNNSPKTYPNAFRDIMLSRPLEKYKSCSYKPILTIISAYHSIRESIKNSLNTSPETSNDIKVNKLYQLTHTFLQKFIVNVIKLSSYKFNNYITFETTNDRGQGLTVADKVKSLLTRKVYESHKSYTLKDFKKDWHKNMLKEFQGNSKDISNFIVNYWYMRNSQCSKMKVPAQLHKQIKKHGISIKTIMKILGSLSPVYKTLLSPMQYSIFTNRTTHDKSKSYHKINRIIQELKDMGLTQYYPLILSMYKLDYSNYNIYLLMRQIMEVEMRRQIHNAVHAQYATESHHIWHSHPKLNGKEICNHLSTNYSFDSNSTEATCEGYTHKFFHNSNNKSMLILTYMLAKVYHYLNNKDFSNKSKLVHGNKDYEDIIYEDIFKHHKYQAIHIFKNEINNDDNNVNKLFNNIGNWTIIRTTDISNIDPNNPDLKDLKDTLSPSDKSKSNNSKGNKSKKFDLMGNRKLVQRLNNINLSKESNASILADVTDIINKRSDRISNAYVNAWIKHKPSKQRTNNYPNKNN